MICPKCKKEIPYDSNLCCYCANPIREKCPECGRMESIGKKVCETKLNNIYEEKTRFIKESKGFCNMQSGVYYTMSMFVVIFITLFILFWFNKAGFSDGITISLGVASFILLPTILFTIDSKKNKKAEKLFSKKFPHYAEIIKKVESADA